MKSNIILFNLDLRLQKNLVIGQVCTIQSLVTIMLFLKKIFAHTPEEILRVLQDEEMRLQKKINSAREKNDNVKLALLIKKLQEEQAAREKINTFLNTKVLQSRDDTPLEEQQKQIEGLKEQLKSFYAAQRRDRLFVLSLLIIVLLGTIVVQRQQQPLPTQTQTQTQTQTK
jgi:hypothetical protein